jgi:hypothetical protein
MGERNQRSKKVLGIVGVMGGTMLFGLPAIAQVPSLSPDPNQPATNSNSVSPSGSSVLNPCPGIFYEAKHRDRVGIPEGCPGTSSATPTNSNSANSSTSASPNPCPSIFYEPKYKDTIGIPAGCPATPGGASSTPQQ